MEKGTTLLKKEFMKECYAIEVAAEAAEHIIANVNSGDYAGAERVCLTTNRVLIIAKLPSEYLKQMVVKIKYCVDYARSIYSTMAKGKNKRRLRCAIDLINGSINYLEYYIKLNDQRSCRDLSATN